MIACHLRHEHEADLDGRGRHAASTLFKRGFRTRKTEALRSPVVVRTQGGVLPTAGLSDYHCTETRSNECLTMPAGHRRLARCHPAIFEGHESSTTRTCSNLDFTACQNNPPPTSTMRRASRRLLKPAALAPMRIPVNANFLNRIRNPISYPSRLRSGIRSPTF